jgi:ACT domain-containing protein
MVRTILTAEDIAALAEGARLVVDENTTLTASARELARRRGLEIVEDGVLTERAPSREPPSGAALREGAAAPSAGVPGAADRARAAEVAAAPFVAGGAPGLILVTAVGVNRAGVLAELSSAVGGLGGDIQDVSQRITAGYFHAILLVDIGTSGHDFAAFRDALLALSEPSDYVVTVIDERVFTAMHRLG